MGKLTIILPIFTAHVSAIDIINKLLTSVELYATLSITTVKKTIMPLFSIGGLVVYQKHIFFLTGNIRNHTVKEVLLLHMPDYIGIGFLGMELCPGEGPELREVELIALSFVPECR